MSLIPLSASDADRSIGITTTIPVEILFAGGWRPVDLNNRFITSGIASELVEEAEQAGFPRNSCSWNKGIYATARRFGFRRVAAVVQGDCANTHALAEMLRAHGVEIIPFAFPYSPQDSDLLTLSLDRFAAALGTTRRKAEEWKTRLDPVRGLAHRIDELNWRENRATGEEQHLWMISTSDFFSNPDQYAEGARKVIAAAGARDPTLYWLRLALVGIPPICDNFFTFLESRGARVVFNEIPRQFAMPGQTLTLVEQYSRYTYPYDIFARVADIRPQLKHRRVEGIIHYVQSFCFRQVQDTIVRRELGALPILTLECDRPGSIDMRTETRIEAFLEVLRQRRAEGRPAKDD